jgi:hypothetical protein
MLRGRNRRARRVPAVSWTSGLSDSRFFNERNGLRGSCGVLARTFQRSGNDFHHALVIFLTPAVPQPQLCRYPPVIGSSY